MVGELADESVKLNRGGMGLMTHEMFSVVLHCFA